MISKSLSTSEKFASLYQVAGDLAEFCQALYPLILTHSDDFGRLQGDPFTVKHMCFPASPRSVEQFSLALAHLHQVGLIQRYDVAAKRYIQIENFDPHQQGLHKRTKSVFPEFPGDSGKVRQFPAQEKRTEGKGSEEKRTEAIPVSQNRVDPPVVAALKPQNGARTALSGPIIGRNTHLDHAACDDAFSYCVPSAVHRKFADLLAPKHAGDRDAARAALQTWYPTIWATIPSGTVMGDAFRFWQAHFDAAFATPTAPKKQKMSVEELTERVRKDMRAAGELQ